jgi:hypothetical protein
MLSGGRKVKKTVITMILCVLMVVVSTQKSHAIIWVIAKAAIKKAIRAIDLQVQRKQNKVIWLQNAQKTLENTMAKLKLNEISDWTRKQREQYQKYYDELKKVKSVISYYQRIRGLSQRQAELLTDYQRAWMLVRNDKHFTAAEITQIGLTYRAILNEAVKQVDNIAWVVTSFRLEMSDAKRLEMLNQAADRLDTNYLFLKRYNQQNAMISYTRAKTQQDAEQVGKLYGLQTPNYRP